MGTSLNPNPRDLLGNSMRILSRKMPAWRPMMMDRLIVVTGLVTDITGTPLADVTTEILNHPEYGTATTDETGRFSIPAEGGDVLTIVYQKENYLSSQRKVNTGHNDIVISETIAMIESDPLSTTITFDDNPSTSRCPSKHPGDRCLWKSILHHGLQRRQHCLRNGFGRKCCKRTYHHHHANH